MSHRIRLADSRQTFPAETDQSLLDAADLAGLALPWRCVDGSCGSCRAWLEDGQCRNVDGTLLAARGDASPAILPCRTHARSDLRLRLRGIRSLNDIACRAFELELRQRKPLSPDVLQLDFQVLGSQTLRWLPGQYLELLWHNGERRAFSIANAARGDNHIELQIRHAGHGHFSQWVSESLHVGDRLHAEGPLGTFVPRENSTRPMLLVAGGTGVAPIKAIIEHFQRLGSQRPMDLYWGVRKHADLYLDPLLERWSARLPQLAFVPVVSDADGPLPPPIRKGLVVDAVLADKPHLANFDVYVCGPPPMVDAARRAFASSGLPASQLYFDDYKYAPSMLTELLTQRAGIHTEDG